MKFLESCKNATEVFDRLRPCYGHFIPARASAMLAYIIGYSDGRNLEFGTFNEDMQRYVEQYLGIDDDRWHELIARTSTIPNSEVPRAYAAADFGRKTVYDKAWSCMPTEQARSDYVQSQLRFSGRNGHLAPTKLILVEGGPDDWRIFFLDDHGIRFYEVGMQNMASLQRWAQHVFAVAFSDWTREHPGSFNRPPADLAHTDA